MDWVQPSGGEGEGKESKCRRAPTRHQDQRARPWVSPRSTGRENLASVLPSQSLSGWGGGAVQKPGVLMKPPQAPRGNGSQKQAACPLSLVPFLVPGLATPTSKGPAWGAAPGRPLRSSQGCGLPFPEQGQPGPGGGGRWTGRPLAGLINDKRHSVGREINKTNTSQQTAPINMGTRARSNHNESVVIR